MNNKILIQGIILTLLLVFAGFAYQPYAYNSPSYYGQYNYRYNYAYEYWPYIPYYAYRSAGPYPMPSTCSSWYGYGNNYNSYIYVHNKLDYTYYMNPWLLEPRRMQNHQWYARGLWPQRFYY